MQLQDYARVLLKRGWIIILLAILAAGSAYVFSKLQTPIYRSTVTLSATGGYQAPWLAPLIAPQNMILPHP